MSVIGIDHVQVAVPPASEERCRAFYVAVLGLEEIEKPAALKPRGGLWLRAGRHELHLGVEADFQPARKAHPALAVSDFDALVRRLSQSDVPVVFPEADESPGRRRFFAADPFGNRLEFIAANDGRE